MEKTKTDYFIGDYVFNIRKSDRYKSIVAPDPFTGGRPDFILFNNEVKVYSPDLMYIFSSSDCVELLNRDNQGIEQINPHDLYNIYSDGYKRGESDFINDYGLTKQQLFSINTDIFVQDVKDQYCNVRTPFGDGLVSLKNRNLIAFRLNDFKALGYYCGLLSGLEELVKGNPTLFSDFYDEVSQSSLSEKENDNAPISKPFDIPELVLQKLEEHKFIENAKATPIKWLTTKEQLRVLLTHKNIKIEGYNYTDIKNYAEKCFLYKGKPMKLSPARKEEHTNNSEVIIKICDTLNN
ncbi:MAG: hypothetical protein WCR12_04280 [Dysgonamonadaceae bacterium]